MVGEKEARRGGIWPLKQYNWAMQGWKIKIAFLLLVFGLIGGCEQALFPEGLARSPYERYQILRGQERQATETNAYGGDQPALRERLRPLDTP